MISLKYLLCIHVELIKAMVNLHYYRIRRPLLYKVCHSLSIHPNQHKVTVNIFHQQAPTYDALCHIDGPINVSLRLYACALLHFIELYDQ